MVQAGKARKYSGSSEGHVTQRRESSEFFALSRQNDSQVASEQFGTQEGFTPVNQTGLQDVSKAPLSGAQFIGGVGYNRQLIDLDEATGVLAIGTESASGDVFDIPPGDASVVVIGGDGLTSDLSEIQFPKWSGHRLCLYLNALQTITIKNEPGSVTYKIKTGTGSDVVSASGEERVIDFVWSITLAMWILVGASTGAGGACPVICDENDLGDISGAVNIDWSLANFHRGRLVGDVVFTLINLPVDPKWQDICLEVLQDPVGGHAVAFTNGFNNGFIANPALGVNRYTSWQFYTYENPASTKIIQGFEKFSGTALVGNEWDGFAGYIHAKLFSNQTTDLGVGDHIEFSIDVGRDKLAVTGVQPGQVAGIFSGFTRGHTYECTCYLAGEGAGNTLNFGAQWYDRTTMAFIGTEGTNIAETGAVNRDSQIVAKALFLAVSASDSLEVRITNNTVLTAILEGQGTPSDGTCMAVIKDCGITEESFTTAPGIDPDLEEAILEDDIDATPLPFDPNNNPVFGEIDLAELWFIAGSPGSSADRFTNGLNTTGDITPESSAQTDMLRSGRVMQVRVNKIATGGGVRELSFRRNGANVFTIFFSVGTGQQNTTNNINAPWKAGDLINWRMSGGVGGSEEWLATIKVWYL